MTILGVDWYLVVGLVVCGGVLRVGTDMNRQAHLDDPNFHNRTEVAFGAALTIFLAGVAIIAWPLYIVVWFAWRAAMRPRKDTP